MSFVQDAVDAKVRLLWHNAMGQGEVSSTGSESGSFVAARAFDWRTTTRWRSDRDGVQDVTSMQVPTDKPFNYVAVAGHNLGSLGANVQFQYNDPVDGWTDLLTTGNGIYNPVDDTPFALIFPDQVADEVRLRINANGAATISVMSAGDATVFPEGARPPLEPGYLNPQDELIGDVTEGGNIPGQVLLRTGASEELTIDMLDPRWLRETWLPIRKQLRTQGLFLAWNHENFPTDVIYGVLDGMPRARHTGPFFGELILPVRGIA